MSLRRRMPAAAIAALLALPLAACTPAQPTPTPTTTSAHTPLFASDEEALKAATDAYAAYQRISDEIARDGGRNPERIKPYVTNDQLQRELKGFKAFSENDRHTAGASTFDSPTLARFDRSGGEIEIYLCQDIGATRVLDRNNVDVTPTERPTRLPMDLIFCGGPSSLLLAKSEVWPGKNFC